MKTRREILNEEKLRFEEKLIDLHAYIKELTIEPQSSVQNESTLKLT